MPEHTTKAKTAIKAKVKSLDAWDLYKKGYSYREIAKQLEVSIATIHKYIKRVAEGLRNMHSTDLATMKEEAKERLNYIFREAHKGFEASKEFSTKKVKKIVKTSGGEKDDSEMTISEVEIAHGDIRYLNLMKECVDAINDIFGLNPQKQNAISGGLAASVFANENGEIVIRTQWNTPAAEASRLDDVAKQKMIDTKPKESPTPLKEDESEESVEVDFEVIEED